MLSTLHKLERVAWDSNDCHIFALSSKSMQSASSKSQTWLWAMVQSEANTWKINHLNDQQQWTLFAQAVILDYSSILRLKGVNQHLYSWTRPMSTISLPNNKSCQRLAPFVLILYVPNSKHSNSICKMFLTGHCTLHIVPFGR